MHLQIHFLDPEGHLLALCKATIIEQKIATDGAPACGGPWRLRPPAAPAFSRRPDELEALLPG